MDKTGQLKVISNIKGYSQKKMIDLITDIINNKQRHNDK